MNFHPLTSKIIKAFNAHLDDELAIGMKAYMKGHFDYLGIKSPVRNEILKPFFSELKELETKEWMKVVDQLWNQKFREFQYAALVFTDRKIKDLQPEHFPFLEKMITEKSWWDSVDTVASNLMGAYFKKYPEKIPAAIKQWTKTENFWLHRTCIIFQLKYGVNTDQKLLFELCTKYAMEKEFFIRKAIGWALRQYSKYNPKAVEEFIQKQKLSPLSIKEASKYL
ncbi:MAG: DNA alkylation repair protein [Bacteroidetes bacterium]|nr:DNA alkylation repair protein [Bacteroidota bacterium]